MSETSSNKGIERLRLAVFAGDASGDIQSAALMRALRGRVADLGIWGLGGSALRQAGADLVYDTSRASAIGVVQASRLMALGLAALARTKKRLLAQKPDLALAVDFGAFNLRLCPFLKSLGIPTAYWFPPGSWRRTPPSDRIVQAADLFISPYPWYADSLREKGAHALFLGHPLLDQVRPRMSRECFMRRMDLPEQAQLVALLAGSRRHEVEHVLPVLIEAAARLAAKRGDLAFVVPLSDRFPVSEACSLARRTLARIRSISLPEPKIALAREATQEAVCHSRAAAVCSGSATLEALVAGVPMVVVYRGSRMMQAEYKLRRLKIEHIGMPNILAGRTIVPELRQDEASADVVAEHLSRLVEDSRERQAQISELSGIRKMLEPYGAIERTADALLDWYAGRINP